MQHGFVESSDGRMRDELLDETIFRKQSHARVVIAASVADHPTERPHSALDYYAPANDARDDGSASRAIVQPAPIGVDDQWTAVAAG